VEIVSADRLMVMNAGSGVSHEEAVIGREPIDMLQIFIRPRKADLSPRVQFTDLCERDRRDWRLIVGPEGSNAPTTVRQAIYIFDRHLAAGETGIIDRHSSFDIWLYVFSGRLRADRLVVEERCALQVAGTPPPIISAETACDVVLFLVDRTSPASREGTLSG